MRTAHQRDAIDAYLRLAEEHPELFHPRRVRHIVTDRAVLDAHAEQHSVVLGVAASMPHALFVVDLVQPADGGEAYPYFRLISRPQLEGAVNTVVVGMIDDGRLGRIGDIVLVRQERHATGRVHLELPRGFGEPGLSGEENARAELEQETGYVGSDCTLLGHTYTDTGITDTVVSFYHVRVTGQRAPSPEAHEAISEVYLRSPDAVREGIRTGEITDGLTVQAMMLFDDRPRG